MTKKIREGLARRLRLYRLNEVEGHGDDCIAPWDECDAGTKGYWLSDADDWLKYLDSLGLVRRMDREWPEWVGCWLLNRLGTGNKFDTFNRQFCEDLIRDAIAAVTEPLIEEGV